MLISKLLSLRYRVTKRCWSVTCWLDNSACNLSTTCTVKTWVHCQFTGEEILCGEKSVTLETSGLKDRLILTVASMNTM